MGRKARRQRSNGPNGCPPGSQQKPLPRLLERQETAPAQRLINLTARVMTTTTTTTTKTQSTDTTNAPEREAYLLPNGDHANQRHRAGRCHPDRAPLLANIGAKVLLPRLVRRAAAAAVVGADLAAQTMRVLKRKSPLCHNCTQTHRTQKNWNGLLVHQQVSSQVGGAVVVNGGRSDSWATRRGRYYRGLGLPATNRRGTASGEMQCERRA